MEALIRLRFCLTISAAPEEGTSDDADGTGADGADVDGSDVDGAGVEMPGAAVLRGAPVVCEGGVVFPPEESVIGKMIHSATTIAAQPIVIQRTIGFVLNF